MGVRIVRSSPAVADESCWTRMQNCLCNQSSLKVALYCAGAIGGWWIPLHALKGLVVGSMGFMTIYQIVTHPNSKCMSGICGEHLKGRTWKHVVAGAASSGIGCGFGMLSLSVLNFPFGAVLGIGGGSLLGLVATYTNLFFAEKPPSEDDRSVVVEEEASSNRLRE